MKPGKLGGGKRALREFWDCTKQNLHALARSRVGTGGVKHAQHRSADLSQEVGSVIFKHFDSSWLRYRLMCMAQLPGYSWGSQGGSLSFPSSYICWSKKSSGKRKMLTGLITRGHPSPSWMLLHAFFLCISPCNSR